MLNNLERQTSVPKVYAFLAFVGLYFFFIFFNFGGQILTNIAGFIIPGYYSLEALFSVNKVDDTQWLTVRLWRPYEVLNGIDIERIVLGCVRILNVSCLTGSLSHAKSSMQFSVLESAINAVYWFPFYYTFKFIFTLWLALPQFK